MREDNKNAGQLHAVASSSEVDNPLRTSDGMVLPAQPRVGLKLKVKWGSRYWEVSGWRITAVNSRSFYVWAEGWKQRFLLEEWERFLRDRLQEGEVTIVTRPPRPQLKVVR